MFAKAGGFQHHGARGASVFDLLQTLDNAGSGVLRLFIRVKTVGSY